MIREMDGSERRGEERRNGTPPEPPTHQPTPASSIPNRTHETFAATAPRRYPPCSIHVVFKFRSTCGGGYLKTSGGVAVYGVGFKEGG